MGLSHKKHPPVKLKNVVVKFASIFFPSILLVIFLSLLINYYFFYLQKDALAKDQKRLVSVVAGNLTTELESVISDLVILSSQPQITEYNSSGNLESLNQIKRTFLNYSIQKRMYDQIRLIDERGMEKVRINFNRGKPQIAAQENLQDKQSRYYFKETFQLDKYQIFVSPFDLNMEHHKIEQPLKPMIRFGTPVFDKKGVKKGIVIVNYLGQHILNRIKHQEVAADGKLLLINKEGYWLKGINKEMEWGFMYKKYKNDTFAKVFPGSVRELSVKENGQFENPEGLFTFRTVHPTPDNDVFAKVKKKQFKHSEKWMLISWVSKEMLHKTAGNLRRSLLILNGILFVLLGIISWLFAVSIIRRKIAEQEVRRKEKFEGVVEMAGAVSHELNQPLQAAKTYTQILLAGTEEGSSNYSRLQKLNKQIDKLGKITIRLMHITSYETKDYAGGSKIIDIERASSNNDNSSRL